MDTVIAGRARTPDTAGESFYICSIQGHVARGMYGSFVVEE